MNNKRLTIFFSISFLLDFCIFFRLRRRRHHRLRHAHAQATMLKKIKSKRRLTEPHISPAVTGASPMLPENGDRDKDHAGT